MIKNPISFVIINKINEPIGKCKSKPKIIIIKSSFENSDTTKIIKITKKMLITIKQRI